MYTNISTMEHLEKGPSTSGPLPPPMTTPATTTTTTTTAPYQPPPHHGNSNNADRDITSPKVCRICLEEDLPQTMIAPCRCKGSSRWVHRDCLDEWRLTQPDRAFSKCTECGFEYYLQPIYREVLADGEQADGRNDFGCCCCVGTTTPANVGNTDIGSNEHRHRRRRRCLFFALVSRDICFGTLVLQLVIAALGALVWAVDVNQALPQAWPAVSQHPISMYYLLGWLFLLILIGLYGSIALCCNGCSFQNAIPRLGLPPPPPTPTITTSSSAGITIPSAPTNSNQRALHGDRNGMVAATTTYGGAHVEGNTTPTTAHRNYDSSSVDYYRRARRSRQRRYQHGDGGGYYYRNSHNTCTDCCFYGCYDCHPCYIYNGGNHGSCCCCCCDSGGGGGGDCDCCHHSSTGAAAAGQHDCCCCDVDTSGSNSNNDCGDGAHILLLILLLLAVVLAVIGFFVGVAITVVAFQRVVQNHIHLLQKRELIREFQVMDLSSYDMDMPLPSAPMKQAIETSTSTRHPLPSAPEMPEEDARYLKKMGLMDG
mmetsp:Transcript_30945/g.74733  ORF Transcript_30945/g.74733 Transcript_30945/m.74733 type:complete len:539 (-) Transcript_30945:81-1697(-)